MHAQHVLMIMMTTVWNHHSGETTVPLVSPTASLPVIEILSFSLDAHQCRQWPATSGCIESDGFGRLGSRKGRTLSVDGSHDPFKSVRLRDPGSASA